MPTSKFEFYLKLEKKKSRKRRGGNSRLSPTTSKREKWLSVPCGHNPHAWRVNLALQLDGAGRILGFDLRDFLLRGSALGANQALGAGVRRRRVLERRNLQGAVHVQLREEAPVLLLELGAGELLPVRAEHDGADLDRRALVHVATEHLEVRRGGGVEEAAEHSRRHRRRVHLDVEDVHHARYLAHGQAWLQQILRSVHHLADGPTVERDALDEHVAGRLATEDLLRGRACIHHVLPAHRAALQWLDQHVRDKDLSLDLHRRAPHLQTVLLERGLDHLHRGAGRRRRVAGTVHMDLVHGRLLLNFGHGRQEHHVHAVDQAVLHDLLLDGGDIHVLAAARADDVEREVRALVTLLPAVVDLHAQRPQERPELPHALQVPVLVAILVRDLEAVRRRRPSLPLVNLLQADHFELVLAHLELLEDARLALDLNQLIIHAGLRSHEVHVPSAVQDRHLLLREERSDEVVPDRSEQRDEEGEHHRDRDDLLQCVEDDQASQLQRREEVHAPDLVGLRVGAVLRELGAIPDQEQLEALEELIASHGPDAHEEEHAVEHSHGQELQHLRKHEGQADEQMDAEVGHALLGHARRLLLHLAVTKVLRLVVREGLEVRNGAHGSRMREGQPEEAAHRVHDEAAHEQVQVVRRRLLQVVVLAVNEHRREVLVQVPEDRQADRRDRGEEDSQDRGAVQLKRLLEAHGQNDPGALQPSELRVKLVLLHDVRRLDHIRHAKHLHVRVLPDPGETDAGQDRDRHAEVRDELAQSLGEAVHLPHALQVHSKPEREEREQRRQERAFQRERVEVAEDLLERLDDEDQRDEGRKDLLREPSVHLHHRGAIGDRKDHGEQGRPEPLPDPRREELQIQRVAELVEDHGVSQLRPGGAKDAQGLPGKERVGHPGDRRGQDHLHRAELPARAAVEQATEGDGRRQAGEEEEERGRQHLRPVLRGEGRSPVIQEAWGAALQILTQTTAELPREFQALFGGRGGALALGGRLPTKPGGEARLQLRLLSDLFLAHRAKKEGVMRLGHSSLE